MFFTAKRAAALFAAALIIASAAPAVYAQGAAKPAATPTEAPADPKAIVGDWTISIDGLPGGPQLGEFSAKEEGGALKGTFKSSLGERAVDSITVNGAKHEWGFSFEGLGQTMDVQSSVKAAGDKFEGTVTVGGGIMEAGLKGAKKGSAAEAELKTWVAEKVKEVIGVPELPVGDAKDFMGTWMFKGESPMGGEAMDVEFDLIDVEGKASGKLKLPEPLGTQTINRLKITDSGSLQATYSMQFAGQQMDMLVDMDREGAMLNGLIDVGGGLIQIPLEGVRKGRGMSKVTIGGKDILVEYGRPSTSGPGYKSMNSVLKDGFIWRMGKDDATSLKTNVELKFDGKSVAPGLYTLRAKRVGNDWHLLLDKGAKGPGDAPGADTVVIPTTTSQSETEHELLEIGLSQASGKGIITVSWGKNVSTASFDVVLPPTPTPRPAAGAAK